MNREREGGRVKQILAGGRECKREAACESVLSTPHFTVMNGRVFGIRCKERQRKRREEEEDRKSREMQDYRREKSFAPVGISFRIPVAYRNGSFDAMSMAGKLG